MRIVVQRVSSASVRIEGSTVAAIGPGFLLLVGVATGDDVAEAVAAAEKLAGLRLFPDEEGRMNLSVPEVGGEILLVSQFTLLGEVRKGRRPSFGRAARPPVAEPIIDALADALRERGLSVSTGVFGARMEVELVNEGPVTLLLEIAEGKVR